VSARGTRWSARLPLTLGFAAVLLAVGGLGAWGVGTEIAGAVVAPGTVEVQSERQVIQHPDGGVVGEILAREGDSVQAGDVLLRLDGTFLRSELAVVEARLAEIFVRRARLEAERDGSEAPDFSARPRFDTLGEPRIAALVAGQRDLFDARRASLARERRLLAEQAVQIDRRIEGLEAQLDALRLQQTLVSDAVADARSLFARGLLPGARLSDLQREDARLQGEAGRLTAMIAEARAAISALSIERLRLAEARRERAIARLRDLGLSEVELEERRIGLRERIARLDIRAPVPGTVFASRVVAELSVVQGAEPMMYIVPGDGPVQVSARIDPTDIEQVFPGQQVALMLTSFDRRTTPELPGRVVRVSADARTDGDTGAAFYEAVVMPDQAALAAMADVTLVPGMPVETFVRTGDRTPLSYLLQPLAVYFQRAFRED
jgi:HlyD family secretion protein